jgi:hypothetical protein
MAEFGISSIRSKVATTDGVCVGRQVPYKSPKRDLLYGLLHTADHGKYNLY